MDTPKRSVKQWPLCECGHLAQDHSAVGICDKCNCTHYAARIEINPSRSVAEDLIEALKALKFARTIMRDSDKAFGTFHPGNVAIFMREANRILAKYPNLK
jgi:hypothetical protein